MTKPTKSMATYASYLLYYRGRSGTQLLADQAALENEITIFSAQNQGQKGMTRALDVLNDRLTAIQFIINERRVPFGQNIYVGTSNFNRILD